MFQLLPINFFREKAGGCGFDYDYVEARQRFFPQVSSYNPITKYSPCFSFLLPFFFSNHEASCYVVFLHNFLVNAKIVPAS